jgi:hypothetical protein
VRDGGRRQLLFERPVAEQRLRVRAGRFGDGVRELGQLRLRLFELGLVELGLRELGSLELRVHDLRRFDVGLLGCLDVGCLDVRFLGHGQRHELGHELRRRIDLRFVCEQLGVELRQLRHSHQQLRILVEFEFELQFGFGFGFGFEFELQFGCGFEFGRELRRGGRRRVPR